MKAKRKPIEKIAAKDLGVDITPTLTTVTVNDPPARVGGGKVANVDEVPYSLFLVDSKIQGCWNHINQ
jgi:electron transfer flavoprotein beta subunit